MRSNARIKSSITPSTEKESTTNDNGSSTDEAESEGNNRLVAKAWAEMFAIFQVKLVDRNANRMVTNERSNLFCDVGPSPTLRAAKRASSQAINLRESIILFLQGSSCFIVKSSVE